MSQAKRNEAADARVDAMIGVYISTLCVKTRGNAKSPCFRGFFSVPTREKVNIALRNLSERAGLTPFAA
jgi:hypothetical protein